MPLSSLPSSSRAAGGAAFVAYTILVAVSAVAYFLLMPVHLIAGRMSHEG
jgi:hypothetical protein